MDQDAVPIDRRPSMADVARAAGVSGQTVSRVVNGRVIVDGATRQRVLDAMHRVGYRPNSAARALRNGQFHSLGVIMSTLATVGNSRTLNAIASAAVPRGYSITLMPVGHTTQGEVTGAFSRLNEQLVDGVVVLIDEHELDHSEIQLPHGLPVVVIDSNPRSDYPMVDTDQAQGAELATTHLLELGHRTVHHLAGPRHSYAAEHREKSWRATLRRHHREVPEPLTGDWSAESGHTLGATLANNPDVTAIFAGNDQMALGLLRALHEHGRRVPHDISVVGFDDTDEAAHFWPPLTTIRQSFADVGRRAVDTLLAEITSGTHEPTSINVPTTLVPRSSTAAPPPQARA